MKKITIITGHYGSGKTNLAVNLALRLADAGEKVTIVDFDIVNPYFRTADFAELFQKHGVTLAASMYANTSLDIPAISFDMERMAYEPGYLIVDVGGDDAGAIGLGRYAEGFSAYVPEQLDMWYVINRYRYLTERPEETLELIRRGVLNNSIQKNPYAQGYIGVRTLVEYLVSGKKPEDKTIYVGSEVVFASNLTMYEHGRYHYHFF